MVISLLLSVFGIDNTYYNGCCMQHVEKKAEAKKTYI